MAYFYRKEYLRHRAVSLRQHSFLVINIILHIFNGLISALLQLILIVPRVEEDVLGLAVAVMISFITGKLNYMAPKAVVLVYGMFINSSCFCTDYCKFKLATLTHSTPCSTRPAYLHSLVNHIPTHSLRSANTYFHVSVPVMFRCTLFRT